MLTVGTALTVILATAPAAASHAGKDHEAALVEIEHELLRLLWRAEGTDAGGAWKRLHELYLLDPEGTPGSADENWDHIPVLLLSKHWRLLDELAAEARKDPRWFDFVLDRLAGPTDAVALRRAAKNAELCPPRHVTLCRRIKEQALAAAKAAEEDAEDVRRRREEDEEAMRRRAR